MERVSFGKLSLTTNTILSSPNIITSSFTNASVFSKGLSSVIRAIKFDIDGSRKDLVPLLEILNLDIDGSMGMERK